MAIQEKLNQEKYQQNDPNKIEEIAQQCRVLDSQIRDHLERIRELEEEIWKISNLGLAQDDLSEAEHELEKNRKKLIEWPRGILGVKDKKGYEKLYLKIEDLEKDLKQKRESFQDEEFELRKQYSKKRSIQEIEEEKQSLQERIEQPRISRRMLGIKLFEKPGDSSLEEALEMYGDLFFGPEDVQRVFGLNLRLEDIPPLPAKEKLEKAKDLKGVSVILALKAGEGQTAEWKLFSNRIINPETLFKDYIEETRGIREFLKKHGLISQEELDETTDEELNELAKLMKSNESVAFQRLINMKINQSRRHSLEDMIYFVRLIRGEANDLEFTRASHQPGFKRQDVLDDSYESTKSYTQDEKGVWVQRIGKFTDARAGGYMKEGNKPTSNKTSSGGDNYEMGVRVIL